MSTLTDLIDSVKARVDGVANIGQTYSYYRFAVDEKKWLDLMAATIGGVKQTRVAMVCPGRTPVVSHWDTFGSSLRTYTVLVVLIQGVSDSNATERTHTGLVEAVMDALDTSAATLGVTGVRVRDWGPAQWSNYSWRQFGSPLCHYSEISFAANVEKVA